LIAGTEELPLESPDVVRHEPVHAGVGVEVAVTTLVLAEGEVDIKVLKREQAHTPLIV
jgi:hypothetical protein